ncbi:MAG TPA: hypothetical protein VGN17_00040 [Bryobacteraceae bacterium]|jgi:hypothetical protein
MKTFTKLGLALCLTAALGFAENFSGKLVDANCKAPADQKDTGALSSCAPTRATTVFAVQTPDGKMYRLDASGNSKAMASVKQDPDKTNVTISGSLDGQTLKVESIEIR